ncbi:hypothetical protein MBLNU457_g1131t2 [Dothideomycetes sp. NU457]
MPLVLISGYPSSGKTYRSNQLLDFFRDKISTSNDPRISKLKLVHINDQSLGIDRNKYDAGREEKNARAAFSSAIKRDIGRDVIVVADGMNYIKGYRYQLYCEAKAVSTPNCVVHVGTPIDKCREINNTALENGTGGYDPPQFENLVFRYEEPNGMSRWDSPLFTLPYVDPLPPNDAIWDAMFEADGKARAVKPNAATVLKPASGENYLYDLDKITSETVAAVLGWQKEHAGETGGLVKVAAAQKMVELPASQEVSAPQLQRLRRQFIGANRVTELTKARIGEVFVDYLNDAFGK